MLESISMRGVVSAHYRTFRNPATNETRRGDIALHIGIPVALGLVWYFLDPETDMGNLISILALLTGLFLALLVFIFQLRLGLDDKVDHQRSASLLALVDAIYHNVVYASLISGIATIVGFFGKSIEPLAGIFTSISIALTAHVALTFLVVLRRTHAAYVKLLEDKRRARASTRS